MMLRGLLLLACGLFAGPLAAVPLWSVEDADTGARVLLLGSVHLLRAADQPLPAAVHTAYQQARHVLMELDPAAHSPEASAAGRISSGPTAAVWTEGAPVQRWLGTLNSRGSDQPVRS